MSRYTAVALLLAVTLVGTGYAQGGPPSPPQGAHDPRAVAILARCAAAMGTHQLQDSYVAGTITPADPREPASTVVSSTKGLELVRHDVSDANGTRTMVVRFGKGHSVQAGTVRPLARSLAAYYIPEHVPALACSVVDLRPVMNLRYVGQEAVGPRTAHHLVLEMRSRNPRLADIVQLLSEYHVYIDTETFVVLKTTHFVFSPDNVENRSRWSAYYSDYRTVNGVLMPFHITRARQSDRT